MAARAAVRQHFERSTHDARLRGERPRLERMKPFGARREGHLERAVAQVTHAVHGLLILLLSTATAALGPRDAHSPVASCDER